MARGDTDNQVACVLAFVGGALFIVVGWTGQRGIDRLVVLLRNLLGENSFLRLMAIGMLSIAALGGFAVILGGLAILDDHVWGGRVLIYLGAGGGIVTLVALGWLLFTQASVVAAQQGFVTGLAGLAFTVGARLKAKAR